LGLRCESVSALLERLRGEVATLPDTRDDDRAVADLERAATEAAAAARVAARDRDDLAERARLSRERTRAVERVLAEQEGLPPAARALAEGGERLALAGLEVPPGSERAVAAALGPRASAVLAPDARAGLRLLEQARAAGLGSLVVLAGRRPQELVDEFPVVPLPSLLDATVPSVTPEGFGYDPLRGELWFAGETAEAVLLELQARRRALALEADDLERKAETAVRHADEAAERARAAEAAFGRVAPGFRRPALDRRVLERLVSTTETLAASVAAAQATAGRFESPLRARVDAGAARAGRLGEELRRLGAAEVEIRQELEEASASATAVEVELARLEAEADEARRRLQAAGEVEPAEGDDREELAARTERLEARRIALGLVNPLAREEYEVEKERLEDLRTQREDLERSLEELERLREELADTVERRFSETFAAVAQHFEEVAATLFPGGEGRLRLVEPEHEADGADGEGEIGVEVELRPAGKRITRLSLLSGGEKALGAISFLFALFLARPCAFYLLDEVEAALDDANIARFVELLRQYSDRAQFVVVTHQKRTMEAADVLYGVTMAPGGVSQVVSRRLPRTEAGSAAA
jgi:chromosome segregation ATPase